ncbi:hypothetical protein DFH09DRAFT_1067486 [Mycena vulgaris]|nr:hypothetical protein DFH09DRAFT_1067486 [Mycena vulgaris]
MQDRVPLRSRFPAEDETYVSFPSPRRFLTLTPTKPVQMSPYGQKFNIFSGLSDPFSSTAESFAPIFGYTAANPGPVYADLVDAYRILRLSAPANAALVSPELQSIGFGK